MATLQVRGIDDRLKQEACNDNRSPSQEVVVILQDYLGKPRLSPAAATEKFLQLSWEDKHPAVEIISDIYKSRRNKKRFGAMHGIFD